MKEVESLTSRQVQKLISLTKDMSAGGDRARAAIKQAEKLTKAEEKAFEWLGDRFEIDANLLRDPANRLMLIVAEDEGWSDLLKRLHEPEKYTKASYPLHIDEVGELLRSNERCFPSNSTLRRLASVVDAPRLGAGKYRVFFAKQVLHMAFLALGPGSAQDEVETLARFAKLDWTLREAAILLSLPDTDPYLRKKLEAQFTKELTSGIRRLKADRTKARVKKARST